MTMQEITEGGPHVTAHILDTAKLMNAVDRARRAGQPGAVSYRQIAREIGAGSSSIFTRLREGARVDADTLCSLLLWVDPNARLVDYTVQVDPPLRRRRGSLTASAAS
jgi:hypothetical protein